MILHFVGMVSTLPSNAVLTLTKAEVSAILQSMADPVLLRSLYRIHQRPGMTVSARLAISCSHRSNLFNALPSPPDSETPFKTHSA